MFLKYLIPFDRFIIRSPLSSVAAAAALQAVVEPRKWLRIGRGSRDFEGQIEGGRFKVTRLIGYNNSFLPVVIGRIEPAPGGCDIHIHMRMTVFTMAFCALWFGFAFFTGVGLLAGVTVGRLQAEPALLIPVGMLAFFLLLVNGAFRFEATRQTRLLKTLFRSVESQSTVA